MPKKQDVRMLATPSCIRISMCATLTGVNMSIDTVPSARDPMMQRATVLPYKNLDEALRDVTNQVFAEIDRVRDQS